MSTETTKGAGGRGGCEPWCGLPYRNEAVPVNAVLSLNMVSNRDPAWCSPLCRDERRGPVGSRLAPDASAETPLQAAGGHADSSHAPAVGEKPALSPPPMPAPGQRWQSSMTRFAYDVIEVCPSKGARIAAVRGEGQDGYQEWCRGITATGTRWIYLGPTPTETPSPAHPPTAAPLHPPSTGRAAVGAGGPPAGYVPCSKGCGRWTMGDGGARERCWTCHGLVDGGARERFPDWTPPGRRDASPARPTRPAGITCKRCLTTSEKGDAHLEACPVMRERGPSAVAMAPGRARDTFADLADDWDLLPWGDR